LLSAAFTTQADEQKSFSKQMNQIKRSGNYVYVESSAPDEEFAKSSCEALLNIEISKYLAATDSQSQTGKRRIGNHVANCKIEYLTQSRGDLVRVFGYVSKSSISSNEKGGAERTTAPCGGDNKTNSVTATKREKKKLTTPDSQSAKAASPDTTTTETASKNASQTKKASDVTPVAVPAQQQSAGPLKSKELDLAKWQLNMLENIATQSDIVKAKRMLNKYRTQKQIKRLGDKATSNPRPTDTFYIIFDNANKPIALLAPSATDNHYDMISGTTVSLNNYSGNQYYWFQISQ